MIVEQKDIEKELADLRSALEQSEQDNLALLRSVSHDIKAPLNQLHALSTLLNLTGENLTDEQKEYVDRMDIVVKEGLTLIRNLLDLREVDYRSIQYREDEIDVDQVLQKVIGELGSLAVRKDIRLSSDIESIRSRLDEVYTARVFDNLISNAIKYTPLGGMVHIDLTNEVKYLALSVANEGQSIPTQEEDNLFKKFSILSPRPTAGENTSGIGLYVAQKMAQGMDGYIEHISDAPITTFRAILPIR